MSTKHQPPDRSTCTEREGSSLIRDLLVILGCQVTGEIAQRASSVAIPGPVLGLLLLLMVLVMRRGPWDSLQSNARGLLRHLPLLFVPAGAGVAAHLPLIRTEWLPITASVVGSSVIAILVTAFTMRAVERRERHRAVSQMSAPLSSQAAHLS